jgi:hypothetical protein
MSVRQAGVVLTSTGVTLPPFDNFTMTLSGGNTTETYLFKRGAASVAQWVIVYTDSGRTVLVSGTFTDLSA